MNRHPVLSPAFTGLATVHKSLLFRQEAPVSPQDGYKGFLLIGTREVPLVYSDKLKHWLHPDAFTRMSMPDRQFYVA